MTQLLSDLIYFVTMQESHNSTGDPLKVDMTKPKDCRERQKLLREQNILKQVRGLKGYLVKKNDTPEIESTESVQIMEVGEGQKAQRISSKKKMIHQKSSQQRLYKLWK